MTDPKKTETEEATAQERAKPEASDADAPVEEAELEGVAGGGIAFHSGVHGLGNPGG